MPKTILLHYEINRDTSALFSANHTDYYTIVWERDQLFYVKKPILQLVKEGCLEGGAEYDGRKTAVVFKTGIQNRIPIPINPIEHIYAFPTHSPKLHECSWIFYHHIKTIKRHHNPHQSLITFKHGKELLLDISYHTLERQVQRTSYCIVQFSHRDHSSPYYL
ncbi:competence protein ComK [Halalkalibacter wakoensis]|uniref:competence protein ComK n=1 Tax=Halalkalibacter wakoensis TaxID=127891 RepID=UPI0009E00FC5|nr:competence protein ComK [Halalkalibacter wakoensis]